MFDICEYSENFKWDEVYRMPVWLRNFNLKRLTKKKEDEHNKAEAAKNNGIPRGPF